MSKETQSRLRILIPGLMFLAVLMLLLAPFVSTWYSADPEGAASLLRSFGAIISMVVTVILLVLVAYPLGAIYRILGIRERLLKRSKDRIDSNIKERLLAPYLKHTSIAEVADSLREDQRLLNVFYYFVDNKESLKERAKSVYLNGLLWSSVADATAMALALAGSSFISYLALGHTYYLVVVITALVLCILLWWFLMPRVVAKHVTLGEEQIGYILHLHESELHEKLEELTKAAKK
jgi:Flp pilus assembly protein TadB